jgi:hypothetical protein
MFRHGKFQGAGGGELQWKIDCDSLTFDDWDCIARVALARLPPIQAVVSVPRGGDQLAEAFADLLVGGQIPQDGVLLIVDDVWTTGTSMFREADKWEHVPWHGFVLFARGPVPSNVTAMFRTDF